MVNLLVRTHLVVSGGSITPNLQSHVILLPDIAQVFCQARLTTYSCSRPSSLTWLKDLVTRKAHVTFNVKKACDLSQWKSHVVSIMFIWTPCDKIHSGGSCVLTWQMGCLVYHRKSVMWTSMVKWSVCFIVANTPFSCHQKGYGKLHIILPPNLNVAIMNEPWLPFL